jgi:predicted Zn finger-like uncharacterized protein
MLRIECPNCQTSYTSKRLGINELMPEATAVVTVKCLTCSQDFDARVEPNYVTNEPGWFQKYIMRRKPSTELLGHKVTDSKVR